MHNTYNVELFISLITKNIQTVDMDVQNKVAIITGSAQGLGKAFAIRLLDAGASICLSDVNKVKGEATLHELQEKYGKKKGWLRTLRCHK